MSWFSNIKIGYRIFLSFLLVAIIATVVGIGGGLAANKIASDGTWMYEKTTVPLGELALVERDFQAIRIAIYRGIIEKDNSKASNEFSAVNDLKNNISTQLGGYTKTFIDQADEKMYNDLQQALSEYYKQIDLVEKDRLAGKNLTLEDLAKGGSAASEISKRMEESAREIGQNAAATHEMSATVHEISRTASDLARAANDLAAAMQQFKV